MVVARYRQLGWDTGIMFFLIVLDQTNNLSPNSAILMHVLVSLNHFKVYIVNLYSKTDQFQRLARKRYT